MLRPDTPWGYEERPGPRSNTTPTRSRKTTRPGHKRAKVHNIPYVNQLQGCDQGKRSARPDQGGHDSAASAKPQVKRGEWDSAGSFDPGVLRGFCPPDSSYPFQHFSERDSLRRGAPSVEIECVPRVEILR